MSRIFWDTNLFIYLLEDHGRLTERVTHLAERMHERDDQLFTSTMTLGEVLVRPAARGESDLCRKYEDVLARRSILVPFDREAARIYATARQDKTIKPPDAIQLACAAQARVDLFITNDDRLSGKTIPGIQFIVSLGRAFL
jgi:predicted nucleic acid-binding protein